MRVLAAIVLLHAHVRTRASRCHAPRLVVHCSYTVLFTCHLSVHLPGTCHVAQFEPLFNDLWRAKTQFQKAQELNENVSKLGLPAQLC